MVQEITVQRKLPENFQPKDRKLFSAALNSSFYTLPPLQLNQVAVLQDTVFSPKDWKFYTSHTHVDDLSFIPIVERAAYCSLKKWRKIPHAMWIKDERSASFFHWMTDCLPRIWQGLDNGAPNKVILHDSFRHLHFVDQSLKLLNIHPIYFSPSENLWVKELVLTARTATYPNFHIGYTQETRSRLSAKFPEKPFRKIYASRKYASKRRNHNELDVELLVIKKGFEVVYLEKLNLKEQLKLMAETKTLVALHGAALTNMLFMKENQNVVELRNVGDSKSNCFFNLANALNQNYYYTLNQADSEDTRRSNFNIDLNALAEVLDLLDK